jgi:hypothetical protein
MLVLQVIEDRKGDPAGVSAHGGNKYTIAEDANGVVCHETPILRQVIFPV